MASNAKFSRFKCMNRDLPLPKSHSTPPLVWYVVSHHSFPQATTHLSMYLNAAPSPELILSESNEQIRHLLGDVGRILPE